MNGFGYESNEGLSCLVSHPARIFGLNSLLHVSENFANV